MRNLYVFSILLIMQAFSFRMIDIGGKGYITYPEFEMVIQSTQRILGFVDEYFFSWQFFISSITGSGAGSVEMNNKAIEVCYILFLLYLAII